MTELHPVGTVDRTRSQLVDLSKPELVELRAAQGVPLLGIDMRIADLESGEVLPMDGASRGELQCRGPWVAREYFGDPRSSESFTDDGWLRTGDIATMDATGYVRIVDRTKDLVELGGEWISSVELENELMTHPDVAAAVVGVPDPSGRSRPLACVVPREGARLEPEELRAFLQGHVPKWWLRDDVVFLAAIPLTATGKFSKKELRDRFAPEHDT